MRKRAVGLLLCVLVTCILVSLVGCASKPKNENVILATTTSTQDSGLLDVLIPAFEKKTGYKVKPVAVGTGAALTMGEKAEADVLLTHAMASEKKLVDNKDVVNYQLVMHNDFVIVGPGADPARIKGMKKASDAMKKIADSNATFVSRGDNSGTHTKEKELWQSAKVEPKGTSYIQSGTGMGQTLSITSEKVGYTLTDRATYLAQKKNLKLDILVEGDSPLLNIYHVMQVNPSKSSKINAEGAKAFVDFMVSQEGQKLIGQFGVDKYGAPLFFPDAGKKVSDLTGGK